MSLLMSLSITAMIIAYLIGSISVSIIICKMAHLPDPRTQGSGNPGATNMLRFAGKKLAFMTLLLDILKGIIAVLIGRLLAQQGMMLGFVALAAFIGHLYPIFFKFRGGKGVATGLGCLLGLSPLLGMTAITAWITIAAIFRYSSLAALITFSLMPFYTLFLANPRYFVPLMIMGILIIWRHRANIQRLKSCTENRIGNQ